MKLKTILANSRGFTFIDVMGTFVIVMIITAVAIDILANQRRLNRQGQMISSQYRIIAGIRSLAGNPSALRNSMRAISSDNKVVNPALLACAGGNPVNSCNNGTDHPFTLYSPVIAKKDGNIIGVQAITSPEGSKTFARFDVWGVPCKEEDKTCPLIVYTSMRAKCAPAKKSVDGLKVGTLTANDLQPQTTCTVADLIEVSYRVELDPTLPTDPALISFVVPAKGSVTTPVASISANEPQ